jgi:endoglucanase
MRSLKFITFLVALTLGCCAPVNLHPFRHMNSTNGWALRDSWFEVLDWAMKHAQEQGLMVILDLHEFNAIGKDPEGNKEKFLAFWRQISARYQNAPERVVFEILNEPSQKLTPSMWNGYLREALAIIRERNPTRTVITGPALLQADGIHAPGRFLDESTRQAWRGLAGHTRTTWRDQARLRQSGGLGQGTQPAHLSG